MASAPQSQETAGSAQDLDARGLLCPEPLRLAESAMRVLEPAQVLRVHATDPAAPIDFEVWSVRHGHAYLSCESGGDGWVIRIRKGNPSP